MLLSYDNLGKCEDIKEVDGSERYKKGYNVVDVMMIHKIDVDVPVIGD